LWAPQKLLWCLNISKLHQIYLLQLSSCPYLKASLKAPPTATHINYVPDCNENTSRMMGAFSPHYKPKIYWISRKTSAKSLQPSYASMVPYHWTLQFLKPMNQLPNSIMSQMAIEIHQEWGQSGHITSQSSIEPIAKPPQSLPREPMQQWSHVIAPSKS
jgi:hypothetical protein